MTDSNLALLSRSISSQFSLGENDQTSLDSVVNGQKTKYGTLGDYAKRIDQSAQRSYVEEGFLRSDPYTIDQKRFEILFQEPEATVLVKKRMFSSIAENFRPDFMDEDEKLYFKATKTLFQNKCNQIAAYEKLSKIQKITTSVGSVNDQFIPIITTLADQMVASSNSSILNSTTFDNGNPFLQTKDVGDFIKVADKLKALYAYNYTNPYTTWITNTTNLFKTNIGEGTGVIEITNFTSLTTTITNNIRNPGNFSLTISDPYNMMRISEYDIEKAIADSTNTIQNHNIFQISIKNIEQVIQSTQSKLNSLRAFRRASPISFKINPDTFLGRRVVAIVDRVGVELLFKYDSSGGVFPGLGGFTDDGVSVSNEYLKDGEILGLDGLDTLKSGSLGNSLGVGTAVNSELNLFKSLVTAIFSKMQLEQNSKNAFQINNKNTNYTRRKMRANFNGRLIIQPMDVVHIYVSSKSRYDKNLMTGINNLMAGNGMLQNLNKTISDVGNAVSLLSGENIQSQVEKNVYVGPNFPNFMWAMMRSQFVTEKEGAHIFAGVVNSADSNNDGLRNSVSVSGSDNAYYFEQGKINFKPGSDVSNGTFYDPLTPFVTKFDSITTNYKDNSPKLLKENEFLISSNFLKAKNGPNAGKTVTLNNFIQDKSFDPRSKLLTRVFYAPDGLVYKWKEGIGSFVQFGSSLDLNDPSKVGNPNIYQDPFAGQDVMNVISLLICGQPYNFAKYWDTTTKLHGFNKNTQSNQGANSTYLGTLTQELSKSNSLWGNFIPFKSLVVDEASYAKVLQGQMSILRNNADLDVKIQELKELNDKFYLVSGNRNFTDDSIEVTGISKSKVNELRQKANELQANIQKITERLDVENKSYFVGAGDSVTFDPNAFIESNINTQKSFSANTRRFVRRQTNHLTRRMSYSVRANDDRNYFIVDDSYDKDYDIAAYNSDLTDGLKLYNNDFNSVKEKISLAADLLNLEVFCDSQGHVRARAPQYNRMPSSVFQKMMYLKRAYSIQYFPEFLNDLFGTQIDTMKNQIEILEDKIRLDCAVLGYSNDASALSFILTGGLKGISSSGSGDTFAFISNSDGNIADIKGLIESANPDQIDAKTNQNITQIVNIVTGQAKSTKSVYTNPVRYDSIVKSLQQQNLEREGKSTNNTTFDTNSRVDELITRIQTKSGERLSRDYFITEQTGTILAKNRSSVVDVFKTTKDLSEKIKERQKAVKYFFNSIKNAKEFRSLDDDPSISNKLLQPGAFGSKDIPEVFESMIEDEGYDDYGINSGKRFVIRNSQIRNIRYSEKPPEYTSIEVHGTLNNFNSRDVPGELTTFRGGGNALTTAVAIDYDMWRNYGFKEGSPINVPFLSNPESQCAPYAAMILSRARKNILKGTVTISGNEYMQQGEVVYIEEHNLLFYVTSVSHSFTQEREFSTRLDLEYGHSPGEYIPTTLDFIGKMIYNNKDIAGYQIQRQSNSNNEANIGIAIKDPNTNNSLNFSDKSKVNSYSTLNEENLRNIIYTAGTKVYQNFVAGNNIKASVELRVYYDSKNEPSVELQEFAGSIKKILTGETTKLRQTFGTNSNNSSFNDATLPEDTVDVILVNMDNKNDRRSPSQKAIDMSRSLSVRGSNTGTVITPNADALSLFSSSSGLDKIRVNLFNYVVDCWVSFKRIENV